MKKLLVLLCAMAVSVAAQSVESIPFRAVLSSANEVPPVPIEASGTATVWLHIVRNASGQITSGSVDFNVRYRFPGAVTLTGLHIHPGAAGVNGGVVINSGLASTPDSGTGLMKRQGQVLPTNAAGLAALNGILANPSGYYVNLHTTDNPGGAIRGQLMGAETRVLMGLMSPANEVPPIAGLDASGVATVMLIAGVDDAGNISSAEAIFNVNYRGFPEGTNLTGLHIHPGPAGVNGPVVIDSGLPGPLPAVTTAAGGNLHFEAEVNMARAGAVPALYALFTQPELLYVNLHTQTNPGGAIRAQLRNTDKATFQVTMLPSNEVPPIAGLDAMASAAFTLHTVRNKEGWAVAGAAIFDVHHRFPGETQFTGLHIHDAPAGVNGGVTINSGLSAANQPLSTTGVGNIYRIMTQSSAAAFQAMNSLLIQPEMHYINLHTTVNTGGAVRAQLGPVSAARPQISAVISAVSDPEMTAVAPLGLMTIFGSDLFRAPGGSSSYESFAPSMINGTTVTVGGKPAAIVTLGREPFFAPTDYIVAQVPDDLAPGTHAVVVTNPSGPGNPATVTVQPLAPAIYFDEVGALAYHVSDMTLIGPDNPAQAGEPIAILMTGLGPTLAPLVTGQYPLESPASFVISPMQVTIGGQNAPLTAAFGVPGFAGFYLAVVTVPPGVSGEVPLRASQILPNGTSPIPYLSNSANIVVR